MSRSTTWPSPIFCCDPVALNCTASTGGKVKHPRMSTKSKPPRRGQQQHQRENLREEGGARLEEGLDGVERVDGDRGGGDRRDAGGRVAGEHAVAQRLSHRRRRPGAPPNPSRGLGFRFSEVASHSPNGPGRPSKPVSALHES